MTPEVCEKCGVEIPQGTGTVVIYAVHEELLCDKCTDELPLIVYGDRPVE